MPGISHDIFVSRVTWAKINGILYKPKDAYLLCTTHIDDNPESILCFGCIEEILVCSSDLVLFVMHMYKSQQYDDHFHAYVVERTSERLIVSYTNVLDHSVLHCRSINDKFYIATKIIMYMYDAT